MTVIPVSKWRNDAEKSSGLYNTSNNNRLQNWIRSSHVLLSSLSSHSTAFHYIFIITSLAITDAGLKTAATAGRLIIGTLPTLFIQYKTTLTVIFDRRYKKQGTPSLLPAINSDLPRGRIRYKASNFCMLLQMI